MHSQLAKLYTGILWDALRQRPIVVLLEDLHAADETSLGVLAALANRIDLPEEAVMEDGHADLESSQSCGMMVGTSRTPAILGDGNHSSNLSAGESSERHRLIRLRLEALDRPAVLEIAKLAFGCSSLDERVAKIAAGKQL